MKTRILVIILGLLIVACGGNGDKQAKLASLKAKRDKLDQQIQKLEKEIIASGDTSKRNENDKTAQVAVAIVGTQPFNHYIEVQGKLDGEENIGISPRTQGVVKAIYVKEGDFVKRGQVLALLDDDVLQKSIDEVENQLKYAIDFYERQKKLWDQKIGSEMQYLSAKNNKEAAEKRMATLKDQVDMSKITSPIDGSIEEISLKIGQMASPALPTPSFRVVNFSRVKVMADIAEAYANKVQKGDSVIISMPDINFEVKTKVNFTSKFINPINRTFTIDSRFNSNGKEFKANMLCVVKINDYKNTKAITIPVGMILSDQSGKYVYVAEVENGKTIAKRRNIKDGISYNGVVEILEGLKIGDKLVSSGFQNIEDGETIKI